MRNQTPRQTMLITGANRGLGLALAAQMASTYSLYLTARDMTTLDHACRTNGITDYQGYEIDFADTDYSAITSMPLQHVDVLVHCASMFGTSFMKTSHDEMYQWSHFLANTQIMIQQYSRARVGTTGRVMLIGSIASEKRYKTTYSMYKIYKDALHTLTAAVNHELCDEKICATYLQLGSFGADRGDACCDGDGLFHADICEAISAVLALPDGCVMSEMRLTPHAEA